MVFRLCLFVVLLAIWTSIALSNEAPVSSLGGKPQSVGIQQQNQVQSKGNVARQVQGNQQPSAANKVQSIPLKKVQGNIATISKQSGVVPQQNVVKQVVAGVQKGTLNVIPGKTLQHGGVVAPLPWLSVPKKTVPILKRQIVQRTTKKPEKTALQVLNELEEKAKVKAAAYKKIHVFIFVFAHY